MGLCLSLYAYVPKNDHSHEDCSLWSSSSHVPWTQPHHCLWFHFCLLRVTPGTPCLLAFSSQKATQNSVFCICPVFSTRVAASNGAVNVGRWGSFALWAFVRNFCISGDLGTLQGRAGRTPSTTASAKRKLCFAPGKGAQEGCANRASQHSFCRKPSACLVPSSPGQSPSPAQPIETDTTHGWFTDKVQP